MYLVCFLKAINMRYGSAHIHFLNVPTPQPLKRLRASALWGWRLLWIFFSDCPQAAWVTLEESLSFCIYKSRGVSARGSLGSLGTSLKTGKAREAELGHFGPHSSLHWHTRLQSTEDQIRLQLWISGSICPTPELAAFPSMMSLSLL
jgi:hypothetical protein